MKKNIFKLLLAATVLAVSAGTIRAENLVPNAGFEDGKKEWSLFVPGESANKKCTFTVGSENPFEGKQCAKMSAADFARFGISPPKAYRVQPKERYRLSFRVRAGENAEVQPSTGLVAARLILRGQDNISDVPGNYSLYAGINGKVTLQSAGHLNLSELRAPLTTQWQDVQVVLEIPNIKETEYLGLTLFNWYVKGDIFLDDVQFEKVDAETPLSQVVSAESLIHTPGPVLSEQEALKTLDLSFPGIEKVQQAAAGGDFTAVKAAYLNYRRNGSKAKYFVMPDQKPASPVAETDKYGDEICRHIIRNLYGFHPKVADMGKDFNWSFNPVSPTSPEYTKEFTWCAISRMEFWNILADAYWKTGNEKYAKEWVFQLLDFAADHPMNGRGEQGNLWRTLDSSERMYASWPYAYTHFINSPEFTPEAQWIYLRLIHDHAMLLKRGLENMGRTGNWVTSECYGLFAAGMLFPEFKEAAEWRKVALDRLVIELNRQIPPDGYQAELAPNYHYFALSTFVGPYKLAKLNNIPIPDIFREKLLAMYRAPIMAMDQSGNIVGTNDSGPIQVASHARKGVELLGRDPLLLWAATQGREGQAPPEFTVLPYAGFYTMRSGWKSDDLFLFFRGGPAGIGHEHEDKLQIVLRAWNKTLLLDPGNYVYDKSIWRRYILGTPSHNTIIVDGKWQHRGASKAPVTKPENNPYATTPAFDFVAADYRDGYQENVYNERQQYAPFRWVGEIDRSVTHTRHVLFLKPYYALLLDVLDGSGEHTVDAHFHLDAPAARVDPQNQAAFSDNSSGVQLGLYPLDRDNLESQIVQGQKEPMLGWKPGLQKPSPTVRFRKHQQVPAQLVTFLYPYRGQQPEFATRDVKTGDERTWAGLIKTRYEDAGIVAAKDLGPHALRADLEWAGSIAAQAQVVILRRPAGKKEILGGATGVTRYESPSLAFSCEKPSTLNWLEQDRAPLFYNAGDEPVLLQIRKPAAIQVTLPARAWVRLDAGGVKPAEAPAKLFLIDATHSGAQDNTPNYAEYLRGKPTAAKALRPIKIQAGVMTLPDSVVLRQKEGAEKPVACVWDETDSTISAEINLPQAGWYRVKVRYCAQGDPVRSLLINGRIPFAEASGILFDSTQSALPSDGWSNFSDDWRVTALAARRGATPWSVYLPAGKNMISLRQDGGGGQNIDWIELEPADLSEKR